MGDDMRNDLAKARDAWLDTEDGAGCQDGMVGGIYLRNRLIAAFIAGWDAREKKEGGNVER